MVFNNIAHINSRISAKKYKNFFTQEFVLRKRIIFVALISLISFLFLECADTTVNQTTKPKITKPKVIKPQIIKPRLLDYQFSAKKLANKTILILPFRDISGKEGDFTSLENLLFDLARDKFPATKWISQESINKMENGLDTDVLNAWHLFLNRYHDAGRMDTKNIAETVIKPQNIDYLLATSSHTVGTTGNLFYEYFASIVFLDTTRKKYVYDCTVEGITEQVVSAESILEANRYFHQEAFSKMLSKIP